MTALYRCGCSAPLREKDTGSDAPLCRTHQQPIARVLGVRPPQFVGLVSGPYATTKALDPATPTIGTATLTLKPQTDKGSPHGTD